jgi:hypothetical protein
VIDVISSDADDFHNFWLEVGRWKMEVKSSNF